MLRYLQQHLPQYRHEFEEASFARAYALMEQGEPVCHATTLKLPGRERAMLFSRPVLFLPAQRYWCGWTASRRWLPISMEPAKWM